MLNRPLKVHLRRVGDAVIIDLVGDLNHQGETTLKEAYQQATVDNTRRIFFNFERTDYINTSGIAILISIVMEAQKAGQQVGLFGVSPHYQKIFQLVRLPLYANIYTTEQEALASVVQSQ